MSDQRLKEARRKCSNEILEREECYEHMKHIQMMSGNEKSGDPEKCIKYDLIEKRCISFQLCPEEARKYYSIPAVASSQEKSASCSQILERFAFDKEMYPPSVVKRTVEQMEAKDHKRCSNRAYQLVSCLHIQKASR